MNNTTETTNTVGLAIKIIGILEIISGLFLFFIALDNYTMRDFAIIYLIAGIFFGIMFFGFSEIIVLLQSLNNKMDAMMINQHNGISTEKESGYNLSAIANEKSAPKASVGNWICKDCGRTNHSFDQNCSSCGAPKR